MRRNSTHIVAGFAATLAAVAFAAGTPFWGARESMPANTPIASLQKGEFIWFGDATRSGPLLLVVSLDEQRAYVYRNGVLTGVSTVSTGKKGHETPTGVFTILQKNKEHYSNLYDNAPMPYMQRLTWGGIALHAGGLPGYPASHGCIRLPSEFARRLFEVTEHGMTVVVASAASELSEAAMPGFLAPVSPAGQPVVPLPLTSTESLRWQPELAPEGPLSAVLSRQSGPTVLAAHSYGGQVITSLGTDAPNVVGLVYIAGFGLDEGESIGGLLAQGEPTPALAHLDIDAQGYAWLPRDDFVGHGILEDTRCVVQFAKHESRIAFTRVH